MTEFKGYRPAPTVAEFVSAIQAKAASGLPITDVGEIQLEELTAEESRVYWREITNERARRNARRYVDEQEFGRPEPLAFRPALQVVEEKPIAPVVDGTLWPGCITVLAAESGAGKTFVSLNLAAHVDAGLPWFGRKVQSGPVCYVSWEGDALNLRLRALAEARLPLSQFHVLRMSEPLSPAVDRFGGSEAPGVGEDQLTAALDALGVEPVLVVIDTVRASLAGSEDSSENVSAYLRAVRRIAQRVPRAAFLLVHHTGWQDGESKKKRERGSSAFRGNVDATYWLGPGEGDYLEFRCLKARDDARPAPLALRLQPVEVGLEIIDGQKLTTCRVVSVDVADAKAASARSAATRKIEEERALDLSALIAIRDKAPTTIDLVRIHVAGNKNVVAAAVRRIQRDGLAVAGKRGEPYTLTEKGRAAVEVDL